MITRSNLAEQLREYQIRSKHDWASVSFFSSTSSNITTSRVDVVVFVIWELIILAFLFLAIVDHFHWSRISFSLDCVSSDSTYSKLTKPQVKHPFDFIVDGSSVPNFKRSA
ncbi:unnamed protein product [Sphenostylis stenocarpa]|uniref:Uncharacterized protein n=1 Tax=Sphenostylis stenocarpa TaxID=92480 RepID=A0AA86T367_9FABA|nr:unnamed protein product [Sphenostylis stenocarpa]